MNALRDVVAVGLSLSVDVVGWAADQTADLAEAAAAELTAIAETARWIATLSRCTP